MGSRRGELSPVIGLRAHVDDLVALLERDDVTDAVLVGHSYAGMVVREAADRAAERVLGVVLLDAWAGADGDSIATLAPDWFMPAMTSSAQADGDGWAIPPLPPELVGVTDPADVSWVAEMCTPQPMLTFTEPTRLTGAACSIPSDAIVCQEGGIPFREFAESLGLEPSTLDAGHDAMVVAPGELVKILTTSITRLYRG